MIRILLALTLSFSALAVELGEDQKGECTQGVQSGRNGNQSSDSSAPTVDSKPASVTPR
jgi:hypothetical protein